MMEPLPFRHDNQYRQLTTFGVELKTRKSLGLMFTPSLTKSIRTWPATFAVDKFPKSIELKFVLLRVSYLIVILGLITRSSSQVQALSGVGARVSQTQGNVNISLTGKHAPYSEVVMVDRNGTVVAGVLVQGQGSFTFSFSATSDQVGSLKVFGIDKADETNALDV